MYEEVGQDGQRRYTVAQIAAEFGVTRPTIYATCRCQRSRLHMPSPLATEAKVVENARESRSGVAHLDWQSHSVSNLARAPTARWSTNRRAMSAPRDPVPVLEKIDFRWSWTV